MFRFRRKKKTTDPVVVVQRFIDAANRHDALGIAECLHPDFDSMQPIYPSRNFRGSAQVRRNWQAIFQSEPGFRLTLLRSATADGTVWVELHGAGKEVEVAGVFIMGVENNLVRWARVYSAVVDQEFQGPVDTGAAPAEAVVDDDGVHDAQVAAELREMIDAGRQTAAAAEAAAPSPEPALVRDEDTILWAPPAKEEAALPVDDLSTGEVPQVVVDEWAAQDEWLDAESDSVESDVEEPVEPVESEAVVEPAAVADIELVEVEAEAPPFVVDEQPADVDDGLELEPLVAANEPADFEPSVAVDESPADLEVPVEAEPLVVDDEPADVEDGVEAEPVVADEEPVAVEPLVVADEEPVAVEPVAAAEEPTPEPVPTEALADLLQTPPPPTGEPVIELVRPAADLPDDQLPPPPPPPAAPADPDEPEGAVLELKPERRFRRLPRPSGRRS